MSSGVQQSKSIRRTKRQIHRCASCSRKLKPGAWIFSKFTRSRYCLPGQGCNR